MFVELLVALATSNLPEGILTKEQVRQARFRTTQEYDIPLKYWDGHEPIKPEILKQVIRGTIERLPMILMARQYEKLLYETANAESAGGWWIRQPKNAGHGTWQIEVPTAKDTLKWINYVHKDIGEILNQFYNDKHDLAWNLDNNLPYGCALATCIYWRRDPKALKLTEYQRAVLWKYAYNTELGAGEVEHYLKENQE